MTKDPLEMREALIALLAERLGKPLKIARIPGGQSHPVYRVDAASKTYLLRRKPDGVLLNSAHAIDREFRLLSALHPLGIPVPEPVFLHELDEPAGTPFYVMRFVEGRTLWDPRLPELAPPDRATLQREIAACLAQLHAVDLEAAGLADFGVRESYAARQIRRWRKQYEADAQDIRLKPLESLLRRLEQVPPDSGRVGIVHGDWRIDNLRIDPVAPRIAAIVDWELATLGDPVADLAYALVPYHLPHDLGPLRSMAGANYPVDCLLDADAFLNAYRDASGIDVPEIAGFLALSFMRLAAIAWGIAGRVRRGNAVGAQADEAAGIADILARRGLDFLQ